MPKKLSRASARGFSILEVMVGLGLLGILGYFMGSMLQTSLKNSTQSNVSTQALDFKNNIVNDLMDDRAWAKTVAATSTLSCLLPVVNNTGNATCPSSFSVQGLVVKDAGGTTIYNSTLANHGFTSAGALCNTFTATGNDQCPFSLSLTVNVICGGSCANAPPQIQISGTMQYAPVNPSLKVAFSAAKYSIPAFIRGQQSNSLEGTCSMLGGVFNAGPPASCNMAGPTCLSLGGLWNISTHICTFTANVGSCPTGQLVTGFNSQGQLICGQASNPNTCAGVPEPAGGCGTCAIDTGSLAGQHEVYRNVPASCLCTGAGTWSGFCSQGTLL